MSALYGITAEFDQPRPLFEAIKKTRLAGYHDLNAFTPFPVDGLAEELEDSRGRVAPLTLAGGCLGGATAFLMQWYANVIDYPINVAGRPLNSWPSFIPVTFELTVLGASIFAVFGMLALNGLPRLHHPIFDAANFERASKDRFFLCVLASDPIFELSRTTAHLKALGALVVQEVYDEN